MRKVEYHIIYYSGKEARMVPGTRAYKSYRVAQEKLLEMQTEAQEMLGEWFVMDAYIYKVVDGKYVDVHYPDTFLLGMVHQIDRFAASPPFVHPATRNIDHNVGMMHAKALYPDLFGRKNESFYKGSEGDNYLETEDGTRYEWWCEDNEDNKDRGILKGRGAEIMSRILGE